MLAFDPTEPSRVLINGSRKLLEHCSGSDTLMGSAPVWASVIILLLIGFIVGAVAGMFAAVYSARRRQDSSYAATIQDENVPWFANMPGVLRHKRSASTQLPGGRSAGPLSVGMQSDANLLQTIVPVDNPAFRGGVDESAVPTQTLIQAQAPATEIPIEEILQHQNSLVRDGSTIKAYTSELAQEDAAMQTDASIAHQTVLTVKEAESAARQALKAKDADSVGNAYDMDDLDDEWKELLCQIDARLLTMGAQTMDSQERAVAIRSLLVSTARETPEQALEKAIHDIERFRRIHRG